MMKEKEVVIDKVECICPRCKQPIQIAIPAYGMRRTRILQDKLRKLLAQKDEIQEEINQVTEMLKKE